MSYAGPWDRGRREARQSSGRRCRVGSATPPARSTTAPYTRTPPPIFPAYALRVSAFREADAVQGQHRLSLDARCGLRASKQHAGSLAFSGPTALEALRTNHERKPRACQENLDPASSARLADRDEGRDEAVWFRLDLLQPRSQRAARTPAPDAVANGSWRSPMRLHVDAMLHYGVGMER